MLVIAISRIALGDTQDYIRAHVILVKSNVAYFDKGIDDGVAPGETFEIYYNGGLVTTGKISWVDQDISRSEPLDSSIVVRMSVYKPDEAKIRLLAPQANRGGHLTISICAEPHLDPAAIATPGDLMIARLIHRGLLTRDGSGMIVPDLCGDYEIRDLTYTFYISPEAVFHNGKPVEASDVLFSLETLVRAPRLTPFSSFVLEIKGARDVRAGLKNEIAGIFIIDTKTISITLERPFPNFEDYLTGPAGYIIPKPGMVSSGAGLIGAGPYRIKWFGPEAIVVAPFELSNQAVFLDSLIFVRYGRTDEAGLAFELGRLDMMNLVGEAAPKFVSKGTFTSFKSGTDAYVILGINCSRAYQADGKFGKALSFLFDRDTLIRVILGGSGESPTFQIPGQSGADIDLAPLFDPDSASYYLELINKPPRTVTLYVDSRYPVLANVSRYLIGQLQKLGIKTTEKRVDFQVVEASAARTDLDLYLTYYMPVSRNSQSVFGPLLDDDLTDETNFLNFADENIQSLLDTLHIEPVPDFRDILTHGLIESLTAEPPVIFLYEPYIVTIIKDDISGVEQDPMGYADMRRAFIEMGK
jgi:ABC-type transport system substrate-binding protein